MSPAATPQPSGSTYKKKKNNCMKALAEQEVPEIQTQQRQTLCCLATKVAFLFRFMNLWMVSQMQFERIIDQLLFKANKSAKKGRC